MGRISEWWSEECPERGPGLSHAHWNRCDPNGYHPGTDESHYYDQCCHCMQRSSVRPGEEHTCVANGAGRCTICAAPIIKEDKPLTEPDDDMLVEPKAVTGHGPTGNAKGQGRGELTDWDKKRLAFLCFNVSRAELPDTKGNMLPRASEDDGA